MSSYKNPALTVDVIIQKGDAILLVKRGNEPFKGKLALPGGFVEWNEKVEDAAVREVKEETGIEVKLRELLGVYSDPKRDPRRHVVTVVFVADALHDRVIAGSDAENAAWVKPEEVKESELSFDHWKIIQDYLKWRKTKETFWSSK